MFRAAVVIQYSLYLYSTVALHLQSLSSRLVIDPFFLPLNTFFLPLNTIRCRVYTQLCTRHVACGYPPSFCPNKLLVFVSCSEIHTADECTLFVVFVSIVFCYASLTV
jgi:hypothetical protein